MNAMPLAPDAACASALRRIADMTDSLEARFAPVMRVDEALTRGLVSFQDSKRSPGYRWYRYKEAFSAALVHKLLDEHGITQGALLDPFAGSGTALFAAAERGMEADGVELLPVGQEVIKARIVAGNRRERIIEALAAWRAETPWRDCGVRVPLQEIRITAGAYPPETKDAIERYRGALANEDEDAALVLRFALLCALEAVSYTRKDGQYLRWDRRAGRSWGRRDFNKGRIPSFDEAILDKLSEMLTDLQLSTDAPPLDGRARARGGTCLEALPAFMETASYDVAFTSPPYCNRYDYTRTYALELALLGLGEAEVARLRQEMVSCTVENREKDLAAMNPRWAEAVELARSHPLLSAIDAYLESQRASGELNNAGIPRMVRGYFADMACVVAELSRALKPGGRAFMVNDNVRYAGASIPVDLILSDIAADLGLETEEIRALPRSKGNSSQQMGRFAREPLRKCVYIWRKR